MQALASERPLAREAGWDQKPSGESRLGYDGNEGIYFDRTKTTDEVGEDGEPLFEEADPEEICYEIEQERDALKTRLKQAIGHIDDMTAALTRANLQPQEPEGMRDGVENTPPRVENPTADVAGAAKPYTDPECLHERSENPPLLSEFSTASEGATAAANASACI